MKKKIFTLLTLGLMLSFVCSTVNAQLVQWGTASVNNTVYSDKAYWPEATDYADVTAVDALASNHLYVGCEYVLTLDLNPLSSIPANTDWVYIGVPRSITTTLPDSIKISLFTDGDGIVKIPFTITANDTINLQKASRWNVWNPNFAFIFSWYTKDANDNLNGRLAGAANTYPEFDFVTPPVISIKPSTTYPNNLEKKVTASYTVKENGLNSLTYFSLDGGITWTFLDVFDDNGDDTGVYTFTSKEVENMTNYILLKHPNSCTIKEDYIYGEDYPGNNPTMRAVTIPKVTNVTTYPLAGVHYTPSQRDFVFNVTLTGADSGKAFTVKTDPEKYTDGTPVPIVYDYIGNGMTRITIKQVRTALNIDILVGVGNEAIAGTNVWAEGGQVFINSVAAGSASIYTATGALAKTVTFASGELASATLPAGFYVAVINGNAFKFIIK